MTDYDSEIEIETRQRCKHCDESVYICDTCKENVGNGNHITCRTNVLGPNLHICGVCK